MRLPIALVTFLLTLLYVTPSFATTIVTPDGQVAQPYQTWANQSLVPTPPGTVTLTLGSCPGAPEWAGGCAIAAEREIYLGPGAAMDKARFLHELGHIYDAATMSNPLRAQFATLVHRPANTWAGDAATSPPQEQFAEAYSLCARRRTLREMAYGMYDYMPTPARHRRACAIIRQAATVGSLRRAV